MKREEKVYKNGKFTTQNHKKINSTTWRDQWIVVLSADKRKHGRPFNFSHSIACRDFLKCLHFYLHDIYLSRLFLLSLSPQHPIKVKPLYFIVMMTTLPESIDHLWPYVCYQIYSNKYVINQLAGLCGGDEMKSGEQMEINIFIIIILQYSLLLCASLTIKKEASLSEVLCIINDGVCTTIV